MNFRKAKETLFGMQFVLTDGMKKNSGNPMRSLMILFIIDVSQVFRVMLSPTYGWNKATYSVAKHVDMVYNVTALLSLLVNRFTFFGLAFLMVVFAVGDAFYCAWLFKAGDINKIGPIKALRFMVAVVVTTLFSSVMKWLLIPLECLVSDEGNFSENFHGEGAPCTPWGIPEIFFTVPTLIIVVLYFFFAVTVAFFSLGTNPLSCAPHVQFTGRIEALFILSKVFATFLPFLSETITPIGITIILFACFFAVLRQHLNILPFHHLPTNMLRGGIYFSIVWLAFSSVIVAAIDALDALSEDTMQLMQWLLVGCTIPAFSVGILLVWRRRTSINFSIDRLRGEFETQTQMLQQVSGSDGNKKREELSHHDEGLEVEWGKGPGSMTHSDTTPFSKRGNWQVATVPAKPKGALAQFLNPSWERKRAFITAQDALSALRTLLMSRSEWELPFLRYMMSRAMDEHPDSQELQVLQISLLRFVFCQTTESSQVEKRLRNSHTSPAVDHEYLLYAIKRKAAQDSAAATIGNGVLNAINLMEFDSRMQQARTAHMQCIIELRKFWSGVSNSKRSTEQERLQQTIDRLVEFNRCVSQAQMEYQTLMEKYPQSTQVIATYIAFCDTVLNDPSLANELRKQADALQEDADVEEEDESPVEDSKMKDPSWQAALEQRSQRSGASGNSENDDFRVRIQRSFAGWSAEIFGSETKDLMWVARRLKICFAVLFACSAGGFGVMQFFLFENYAQRDSHLINQTGGLRTIAVTALYNLRSMLIAAADNDRQTVRELGAQISADSVDLQVRHYRNYQLARGEVKLFYREEEHGFELRMPYASGWQSERMSVWNFGNEIAHRMDRASTATMEELQSPKYDINDTSMTDSKLSIVFLNENAFRVVIPAFSDVVTLYEDGMRNLWSMTQTIVAASTGAALAVLCAMLALVVLRLFRTIRAMQHLHLACHLAIALPLATTRKISKFYKDAEHAMQSLVDEDAAKRDVENAVDDEKKLIEDGHEGEHGMPSPAHDEGCGGPVMSLVEDNLSLWTQHVDSQQRSGVKSPLRKIQRRASFSDARDPSDAGKASSEEERPEADRCAPAHLRSFSPPPGQPDSPAQDSTPAAATEPDESAEGVALIPAIEMEGKGGLGPAARSGSPPRRRKSRSQRRASLPELSDLKAPHAAALSSDFSTPRAPSAEKEGTRAAEPEEDSEDIAPIPAIEAGGKGGRQAAEAEAEEGEEDASDVKGEATDKQGRAKGKAEKKAGKKGEEGAAKAEASAKEEAAADEAQADHAKNTKLKTVTEGKVVEEEEEEEEEEEDLSLASGAKGKEPNLSLSHRKREAGAEEHQEWSLSAKGKRIIGSIGGILKRSWAKPKLLEGGSFKQDTRPSAAKEGEVAADGRLPLREVSEETAMQIRVCARRHERFSARIWVWVVSMAVIVGLSMMLNWFPARRMSNLVLLAPTINHSGRRRTLTRACVHLTRELVINDGLSRMNKLEVAEALAFYLNELRVANDAVRLGGALGIAVGADARNEKHNKIMYNEGCYWRANPENCSYPLRPGVAAKGLYQVSLAFMNAIESVLDRYGPPEAKLSPMGPHHRENDDEVHDYDHVVYNATRAKKIMTEDRDVAFILDNFDGDLFQGYALIVQIFDEELQGVIQDAMTDNKAIFAVFVLVTFVGVYWMIFLTAVKEAFNEGAKARTFVARIPAHTLNPLEIETLSFIFQGRRHHEEGNED